MTVAAGLLAFTLAAIPDYSMPGRHPIDSLETRVVVPATGHSLPVRVFWPRDTAPAPVVILGHGWMTDYTRLRSLGRQFASWGFLVLVYGYPGGPFPSQPRVLADLLFLEDWLAAVNRDPGNRLGGRADTTRLVLGGHSLGGGLAVVAAARGRPVAGLVLLAPAQNRAVLAAAARDSVPAIVLAATNDEIAPPSDHARRVYDALPGTRYWVLIRGGTHNQFMDHVRWYEDSVDGEPGISRDRQQELVRRYATLFLMAWVKQSAIARGILDSLVSTDPDLVRSHAVDRR